MILNETQQAVQEAIRAFAQDEVKARSAQFEAAGGYPPELFTQMGELGLMGVTAPEEGSVARGLDMVSYALALIEIGAADGALSTIMSVQNSLVISGLLREGSADQEGALPARPDRRGAVSARLR